MRLDLVLFSPSWLIWSYLANYWISHPKFLTIRFSNDHRSSGRKQRSQPTWGLTKIVPKCFKLAKLERSADFKMPVARRWWSQWVLTGLDDCTVGKIHAGCFAVFSSLVQGFVLMCSNTEAHQRSWLPWNYWPTPQWLYNVDDLDDLGWTWYSLSHRDVGDVRDSSLFAIYRDLTRIIQLIALITIISTICTHMHVIWCNIYVYA